MWSLTRQLASSALSDSDRSIGVCVHLSGQASQLVLHLHCTEASCVIKPRSLQRVWTDPRSNKQECMMKIGQRGRNTHTVHGIL